VELLLTDHGFNRLVSDIEDGKINMVVTKDLSRLGRDYIQSGYYVENYFPMKQVRYISILDNIDTSKRNSSENDIAPFRSILNEMYAKDISKKVRIVLQQKKQNGQYLSTSAPIGYVKDPDNNHKLIIDEEEAEIVRRMFRMVIDGYGTVKIANIFTEEGIPTPTQRIGIHEGSLSQKYGYWNSSSIRRILRSKVYIGTLVQGKTQTLSYKVRKRIKIPQEIWIEIPDSHEPIVDEDTFYAVQRILDSNVKQNVETNRLLKGLLKCHECGGSISVSKGNKRKQQYTACNLYRSNSKRGLCTPHTMNYDVLEEVVLENVRELCKLFSDRETIEKKLKEKIENSNYISNLQRQLDEELKKQEKLEKNLEKLYEDRLNDIITVEMFTKMSNKILEDVNKIGKAITILQDKKDELAMNFYKSLEIWEEVEKRKVEK